MRTVHQEHGDRRMQMRPGFPQFFRCQLLRSTWALAALTWGVSAAAQPGNVLNAPNPTAQASSTGSKYPPVDERHPLAPALKLARASRASLESVRDYQCLFIKRELINGSLVTQSMEM